MYWNGAGCMKYASDLFMYQELIYLRRPQIIIECGIYAGGTTSFLSDVMRSVGIDDGHVIGIDIDMSHYALKPRDNIITIEGSSLDPIVLDKVKSICKDKRDVMVILDSEHTHEHVLQELEAYAPIVSGLQYLIVEDTDLPDPGPSSATKEFLSKHTDFEPQKLNIDLGVTHNPGGYLLKIA
jgi:cephalosporin hydroxylase